MPSGGTSHDTFNRVFQILDREVLRNCLNEYGKELINVLSEKQISLDGKKLKGVSPSSRSNKGGGIVNAWLSENKLCIGRRVRVDENAMKLRQFPKY